MQSIVSKVPFRGIETLNVSVQVHMSNGLLAVAIVGLADKAVVESKEWVRVVLFSPRVVLRSIWRVYQGPFWTGLIFYWMWQSFARPNYYKNTYLNRLKRCANA